MGTVVLVVPLVNHDWASFLIIWLAAVLRLTLIVLLKLVRQIMAVSALPKKCLIVALVELDVTSILALYGPALLEAMDAATMLNAAAAHVMLKGLAQLRSSKLCSVMDVALGKVKIVAAGSRRAIQIVSTSRVTVRAIVGVIGNSSNQLKLEVIQY